MSEALYLLGQAGEGATGAESGSAPAETEGGVAAEGQAQTTTTEPGDQQPETVPPGKPEGLAMWWPLLLMGVVVYFFLFRGPKKQQKQHKQMLAALTKGDRIRTIGGIVGTVVDVREDEVVVKIDENTNTKMRFVRSAISTVYQEDQEAKS